MSPLNKIYICRVLNFIYGKVSCLEIVSMGGGCFFKALYKMNSLFLAEDLVQTRVPIKS